MGIPRKLLLGVALLPLILACPGGPTGGGPPQYITYTTTLDPTAARLRPGQSVTFAFSVLDERKQPYKVFPGSMLWTIEGAPSYSVGSLVPITDTPISDNKAYCRFDAAPNLPEGITQVQFTLRGRRQGEADGNILQATSTITVDLNAPAQASSGDQSAGGLP